MIVASAIKFFYEDDKDHRFPQIWTGLRHADIFERMFKMGVKYDKESHIQGFLTDLDEFLDRYEAAYEAIDSKQVNPDNIWSPYDTKMLYSEDVWPEEDLV